MIAVQTAIQTAENAYWDLVYAVENLKAKQEALDIAPRTSTGSRRSRSTSAPLAPIDIVQTEVTIAQREQDIIIAEGLIGDAQDRLRRLLNVQSVPDWNRADRRDGPPDADQLQRIHRRREPGLRGGAQDAARDPAGPSDHRVEEGHATSYTKNQLKPRLDLAGGYGYAGLGANGLGVDADGISRSRLLVDALTQIGHGDYPTWSVGLVFARPDRQPHGEGQRRDRERRPRARPDEPRDREGEPPGRGAAPPRGTSTRRTAASLASTEGARARRAEPRRREEEVRERDDDVVPGRADPERPHDRPDDRAASRSRRTSSRRRPGTRPSATSCRSGTSSLGGPAGLPRPTPAEEGAVK